MRARRIAVAGMALLVAGAVWAGPHAALACAPNTGLKVEQGADTYICVVVNNQRMAVVVPKADDYSRIAFDGSYSDTSTFAAATPASSSGACPNNNTYTYGNDASSQTLCRYTTVHVESHGTSSLAKAFKIFTASADVPTYVFPVMTAVISVNNGEVTGITWDDGCFFCAGVADVATGPAAQCQANMFALPNATAGETDADIAPYTAASLEAAKLDGYGKNCLVYGENSPTWLANNDANSNGENCQTEAGGCDLKIYFVWTGTDKNGNYFTSAGLRFSRFRQFQIGSLYSSARSLSLSSASSVQSTASSAASTVSSRL